MSELEILNDLMNNLEAIDVNRSLDNQSLLNAACSMFLNRGQNLLYIYSDAKVGWLYYDESNLVAVYTEEKADYDALLEIISWEEVHVKEYRGIDIVEPQFSLTMPEFMELVNEQYKPVSHETSKEIFVDFSGVKGAVCYEKGQLLYQESFSEDLPLPYFENICGFDTEGKGVFVSIVISGKELSCYVLKQGDELWVLSMEDSSWARSFDSWPLEVRELINAS